MFSAMPDDYQMRVTLNKDGLPMMLLPGRLVLFDNMEQQLDSVAREVWYPKAGPDALFQGNWIINMLADADRYSEALNYFKAQLQNKDVPVFNHPGAVIATRRDRVWQTLSDVPYLTAPKCIRFRPKHPSDFLKIFENEGFEYPVLIRPAGTHTGKELALIRDRKEWNKLFQMAWGGRDIYIAQWLDFKSRDGDWRKIRLSITKDEITVRHILYADSWLIHSTERDADAAEREIELIHAADNWDRLQTLGAEIRKRVKMDFFGVDIGWKSDDEFVLFEANASMSILTHSKTPQHRREDFENVIARIGNQVWTAIINRTGIG